MQEDASVHFNNSNGLILTDNPDYTDFKHTLSLPI